MDNYFATLNAINVSDKTEKKNGLTYLSWAWAWGEIKKLYPDVNYTVYENRDGWNYHTDGQTCWVKVGVTVNGIEHIEYLPVMDFRNASIRADKVTSFDVNKSIQRALTKAVARHGLGLYVYAGEDLPEDCPEAEQKPPQKAPAKAKGTGKAATPAAIPEMPPVPPENAQPFPQKDPIQKAQIVLISDLSTKAHKPLQDILSAYHTDKLNTLSFTQAQNIIRRLNEMIEQSRAEEEAAEQTAFAGFDDNPFVNPTREGWHEG